MQDSTIVTGQGTLFTGNEAIGGSGGGVHCGASLATFSGSIFSANKAVWGGGQRHAMFHCPLALQT